MMNETTLGVRCREIHADNCAAGWWSDLTTGESILQTRNRGEILMLVVTELSEASEGHKYKMADDKLPHLRMFQVELGDAAIRLMDLIGAEMRLHNLPVEPALLSASEINFYAAGRGMAVDAQLMQIVNCVSEAMEAHRKSRIEPYFKSLQRALAAVYALARIHDFNLDAVIAAKQEFNATRADHKPENRRKEDGKKC